MIFDAKLLGLDAVSLVGDLQRRVEPQPVTLDRSRLEVPFPVGPRKGGRLYMLLSLVIALAVAAVVADWMLRTREAAVESRVRAEPPKPALAATAPPAAVPAPAPDSAASPQPEPTAPATAALLASIARLEFRFERDSWVEVKDGEGTVLLSALHRAGSTQTVEGKPPFALVVGNASGVRVRYNDADVSLAPHTRVDVARLTLE